MDRIATIGFFDGVHRGHQFLLNELTSLAQAHSLEPMVVTFPPRPGYAITTSQEKSWLLSLYNIYNVRELQLDDHLRNMTAHDFMQWLRDEHQVRAMLIGYDHRFGRGRTEGFDDYCRYGKELGIDVVQSTEAPVSGLDNFMSGCNRFSSTAVREALHRGDIDAVTHILGRDYTFEGIVVRGEHIGNTLGFPTANLSPESIATILPSAGVYAVRVRLEGEVMLHHGMMNIGHRPTFNGADATVEVNIFHYSGDLYGQRLRISVCHRLRSERIFASPEELRQQLLKDREEAKRTLTPHPSPLP